MNKKKKDSSQDDSDEVIKDKGNIKKRKIESEEEDD